MRAENAVCARFVGKAHPDRRGETIRKGGKFVVSSPELGTVELDVEAVVEFEPLDNGVTGITLDATYVRGLTARRAGMSSGRGLVPFVMAIPHHASAAAIRDQLKKAEISAAILDVETAFIKDVPGRRRDAARRPAIYSCRSFPLLGVVAEGRSGAEPVTGRSHTRRSEWLAPSGTLADECVEHLGHIVVVIGEVAHDVLHGVHAADTGI